MAGESGLTTDNDWMRDALTVGESTTVGIVWPVADRWDRVTLPSVLSHIIIMFAPDIEVPKPLKVGQEWRGEIRACATHMAI